MLHSPDRSLSTLARLVVERLERSKNRVDGHPALGGAVGMTPEPARDLAMQFQCVLVVLLLLLGAEVSVPRKEWPATLGNVQVQRKHVVVLVLAVAGGRKIIADESGPDGNGRLRDLKRCSKRAAGEAHSAELRCTDIRGRAAIRAASELGEPKLRDAQDTRNVKHTEVAVVAQDQALGVVCNPGNGNIVIAVGAQQTDPRCAGRVNECLHTERANCAATMVHRELVVVVDILDPFASARDLHLKRRLLLGERCIAEHNDNISRACLEHSQKMHTEFVVQLQGAAKAWGARQPADEIDGDIWGIDHNGGRKMGRIEVALLTVLPHVVREIWDSHGTSGDIACCRAQRASALL
eukprot:m.69465 g.69465  ORF g.69465 m.69465 type:complete len:352 (+) comp7551_c0_seq2:1436-2491(+)